MRSLAPLLAASLLVPHAGVAQELVLGLGSGVDYDNNFFADEEDEVEEIPFRVDPRLRVEERTGDLAWGFRYEPTWEDYLKDEAPNGWSHVVRGDVQWQLDDVTSLEASEFFSRTTSVSRFNDVSPVSVVPELEVGRERFKFNTFTTGLTRELTPRSSVKVGVRHFLRDFSEDTRRDIETLGADASYFYTLTDVDTVGTGFGYTRQTFEAFGNVDETSTNYYNLSGQLRHRFSPTAILNLSAGPALVDSDREDPPSQATTTRLVLVNDRGFFRLVDADTCVRASDGTPVVANVSAGGSPLIPSVNTSGCTPVGRFLAGSPALTTFPLSDLSVDDQNITFFADTSFVKRWENWSLTLGYRREASTSTGFGTDSIVDVFRAESRWTPSSRWNVDFLAYWSRQSQASEGFLLVSEVENATAAEFALIGLAGVPRAAAVRGVRAIDVDDELFYDDYTGQVMVSYRLTKNLSLTGSFRYTKQQQEVGDLDAEFDRYRATFLVSYEFDPIHL
jgi:hypothetical protein